ncbi:hypothetical protein BDZ45DRAFT_742644 [Acephala macrosclerotiorum]|nr:hypothetical protein BDZ45DRAFT_742644 [Acephala macrosclerotiorum]
MSRVSSTLVQELERGDRSLNSPIHNELNHNETVDNIKFNDKDKSDIKTSGEKQAEILVTSAFAAFPFPLAYQNQTHDFIPPLSWEPIPAHLKRQLYSSVCPAGSDSTSLRGNSANRMGKWNITVVAGVVGAVLLVRLLRGGVEVDLWG